MYAPDGAARRWLARSHREKPVRPYSSGLTRAMCSSSSCFWVTPKMDGAILGALTDFKCSAEMNSASAEVLPLAKRLYALDGAARRWLARSHRESLMTAYSSGFTRAICNSSSCFWVTSLGALIITSWAFLFMGKGMISRMESSPANSMTMRSTPGAMPA